MSLLSHLRLIVLSGILCLIAAQSVAQLCPALDELERREADVRLEWEQALVSNQTDDLNLAIGNLVIATGELSEYVTFDSSFDTALAAYSFNIMYIYSNLSSTGTMITAEALLTDYHMRLLRRLMMLGQSLCQRDASNPDDTDRQVPTQALSDSVSSGRNLGLTGNYLVATSAILALSASLFFLFCYIDARSLKRVRFMCKYPVVVTDDLGPQTLTIVDISGVGAKLQLNEDRPLKGKVSFKIGRKTVHTKTVWANGHYAGLAFKNSLSVRRVKQISEGVVLQRNKSDRASGIARHHPTKKGGTNRYHPFQF